MVDCDRVVTLSQNQLSIRGLGVITKKIRHDIIVASVAVGVTVVGMSAAMKHFGNDATPSPYIALVKKASQGRAVYVRTLPVAPQEAPHGWRPLLVAGVIDPGHQSVVWASPNKRFILMGAVFNRLGHNVTRAVVLQNKVGPVPTQSAPQPKTAGATGLASLVKAPQLGVNVPASVFYPATVRYTHSIVQYPASGSHGTLYAYVDPDCIFCHHLYNRLTRLKNFLIAHHVQIRWIPVAILRPGGAGRAQAILKGGLPAFKEDEQTFNVAIEKGGIAGIRSTKALAELLDNMRIIAASGTQIGTPTLTWRARGVDHKMVGLPTPGQLKQILLSLTPSHPH